MFQQPAGRYKWKEGSCFINGDLRSTSSILRRLLNLGLKNQQDWWSHLRLALLFKVVKGHVGVIPAVSNYFFTFPEPWVELQDTLIFDGSIFRAHQITTRPGNDLTAKRHDSCIGVYRILQGHLGPHCGPGHFLHWILWNIFRVLMGWSFLGCRQVLCHELVWRQSTVFWIQSGIWLEASEA